MAVESHRLLIRNASQVVKVCTNKEDRLVGEAMKTVSVLEKDAEGLSVAIASDGNIISVGTNSEVEAELKDVSFERVIDAEGMSVIPGLVDAHTHPVWVGDRVHEFAMKVRGYNTVLAMKILCLFCCSCFEVTAMTSGAMQMFSP